MFDSGVPPELLELGLVAVWCGACALYAGRSWPIAMRRALGHLTDRVRAAEDGYERVESKLAAKLVELGALTEELEALAETIETKRRRIAAAESKRTARDEQQPIDDRDGVTSALKQRARAMGWPI